MVRNLHNQSCGARQRSVVVVAVRLDAFHKGNTSLFISPANQ